MTRPAFHIECPSAVAWEVNNHPIVRSRMASIMPLLDMRPNSSTDAFAGDVTKYVVKGQPWAMQTVYLGHSALLCETEINPLTPADYRAQTFGEKDRTGFERVFLEHTQHRLKDLENKGYTRPVLAYCSTEDSQQFVELPNDHRYWAFVDALTGHPDLPRNLRYAGKYGMRKIKSLATYLQTRTPEAKAAWWDWAAANQYRLMAKLWSESPLRDIPVCSWNAPNLVWVNPAQYEKNRHLMMGDLPHVPTYWAEGLLPETESAIRFTAKSGKVAVCHVDPNPRFDNETALEIIKDYNVKTVLIFYPQSNPVWLDGLQDLIVKTWP